MSNTTPNQYRGFLVNLVDTSAHIWSAESSYTLQDELPANQATTAGYDLGVTAAGTFTEPQSIEIQTNRAGHIGQAGFVHLTQRWVRLLLQPPYAFHFAPSQAC